MRAAAILLGMLTVAASSQKHIIHIMADGERLSLAPHPVHPGSRGLQPRVVAECLGWYSG